MGIGNLYQAELEKLGYQTVTVDANPAKQANFTCIADAKSVHGTFETAHICTPNSTHYELAQQAGLCADIVFIEKPGVKNSLEFKMLDHTSTRYMMVKNNQWRDNIVELQDLAHKSREVRLNWINNDRVPNPGTWFTTKHQAFGGVSRDLMPHLLSLYTAFNSNYHTTQPSKFETKTNWQLSDLTRSDYGTVNAQGTYDVDDYCSLVFENTKLWKLTADWRSLKGDQRNIEFVMQDGSVETFELGLCPEQAYQNMIADAVKNIDNDAYWHVQLANDIWIHNILEKL